MEAYHVDAEIVPPSQRALTVPGHVQEKPSIDQRVALWLQSIYTGFSQSLETQEIYTYHMRKFREHLDEYGLDVDDRPDIVAAHLEQWCGESWDFIWENGKRVKTGGTVSASAFNNRIVPISSFYLYCIKKRWMKADDNPVPFVDRPRVQQKPYAQQMSEEELGRRLNAIDRSTMIGRRDYAVLLVAGTTGRRMNEVRSMKWGDFDLSQVRPFVTFPRCKGGKVMTNILTDWTWAAIEDYLKVAYGPDYETVLTPESYLWVSHSYHNLNGQLSKDRFRLICLQHMGTGKFHMLRHAFALMMRRQGAELEDVKEQLGHSNLATTSRYLERLTAAENPYAAKVEEALGLVREIPREQPTYNQKHELNQARVEEALREYAGRPVREIARRTGLARTTIRRQIDRMKARGEWIDSSSLTGLGNGSTT